METYKIIRFYQNRPNRVIIRGVSLHEAQQHCEHPDTSSKTCTSPAARARTRKLGPWFDGYEKE